MRELNLEEEFREFIEMQLEWHSDNADAGDYDYEDDGKALITITLHPPAREAGAVVGRDGRVIRSMGTLLNLVAFRRGRRVRIVIEPKENE